MQNIIELLIYAYKIKILFYNYHCSISLLNKYLYSWIFFILGIARFVSSWPRQSSVQVRLYLFYSNLHFCLLWIRMVFVHHVHWLPVSYCEDVLNRCMNLRLIFNWIGEEHRLGFSSFFSTKPRIFGENMHTAAMHY